MEAVGRLAGGVAHDFNNLLTVIIGYSEVLMMKKSLDRSLHHNVEEIQKAAERAALLTQQLLAFSRKQILQPRIIDLNKLVADLNKMLRRIIGEDIDLITKLDLEIGKVKTDPGQIDQVIMNLAVNARDAMPQGGKLTIETKNKNLDDSCCERFPEVNPGNYVLLRVSDTGHGIDDDTKKNIFEPFFTTKEIGKGTGLGLSTVYGIVKQSGGYIQVYSKVDQGTTFEIYLPGIEKSDKEHKEESKQIVPEGGSETILIVEDEDVVREMICKILKSFGYIVMKARNGDEALAIIKSQDIEEKIDLLITDVIMPEMSGRELAEQLLSNKPALKVMYISGYTDDVIVHHDVLNEGVLFLQKPFSPQVLAQKVREILDVDRLQVY